MTLQPEHTVPLEALVAEIQRVMAGYIPDFDTKFSVNFQEIAINQVRAEKSFEITTARALVFGETGVGKTTTINFLLSSPIFPTSGELSCTKSLACGEHQGGLIFYDSPGLGDEEGLENVTRTVLGIDHLEDEPIEQITLIDLTTDLAEGPDSFQPLAYDAFADEISAEFYARHQANIAAKTFELADFAGWAAGAFDFFIFVASSMRGLPTPIAKTLQAFEQRQAQAGQGGARFFKVFNVFDRKYQAKIDALEPAIRNKFWQVIDRSQKYELSNPEQWFVIDSQTGDGVGPLISAFAEALPLDILRSLNQVVADRYAPLIDARIAAYFFDYTAHIAALIAVFPVDHAEQGTHFLKFAMESVVTMARFMFAGPRSLIQPQMVADLVDELESRKLRQVYTEQPHKVKNENVLLYLADKVGKNLKPDFDIYDQLNAYEVETKRVVSESYYAVGGVDAIQLILSLGLMLHDLHVGDHPSVPPPAYLETVLEYHRRTVEADMAFHIRSQVIQITRSAADQPDKRAMAEAVYPHIRPLLNAEPD